MGTGCPIGDTLWGWGGGGFIGLGVSYKGVPWGWRDSMGQGWSMGYALWGWGGFMRLGCPVGLGRDLSPVPHGDSDAQGDRLPCWGCPSRCHQSGVGSHTPL